MKKYGYFRSMLMSFYSRDLYRDVYNNWGGRVLWYLFLVLAIYTAVISIQLQSDINTSLPPFLEKFAAQAPEVTIKEGIVHTPENRPYLIIDPDTKKIFAIIDTTGKFKDLDHTDADFLLTKDTMYSREHEAIKEVKLSSKINADLKPEEVKAMTIHAAKWGWAAIFPLFLIFIYVFRVLQAFSYAIIGKILSRLMDVQINYFDVFKLSVIALTPAIALKLLVGVTCGYFPYAWFVYFLVAMGYLIFAISSVRK